MYFFFLPVLFERYVYKRVVFSLQNTTSNKYHLSEVSLTTALPDIKGMQTLNVYLVTMQVLVP